MPPCCPHLNPIERLRCAARRHAAQNRHCEAFQEFASAISEFFDRTLPDSYKSMIDTAADNFRVISRDDRLAVG